MKWLSILHRILFSKLRISTHADLIALVDRVTTLEEQKAVNTKRYINLEANYKDLLAAMRLACRNIAEKRGAALNAPDVLSPMTFEAQLIALKELEPNAFPHWWQCFLNGKQEYERSMEGSLSFGAHPGAFAFRDFVTSYLRGNVLDIGCGPQLLPTYFHGAVDLPDVRLFGIDPLKADHPFEFFQGFAEFLPWESGTFDVITIGTSLDHCLSLTRTLDEIKRVLKPGGKVLIWVGFIKGAAEYKPRSPSLKALDEYHLFHFDQPWFEALMRDYFILEKRVCLAGDNFFYGYEKDSVC